MDSYHPIKRYQLSLHFDLIYLQHKKRGNKHISVKCLGLKLGRKKC